MEDIIFILLAVVWLLYSLFKGKSKKKPQEKSIPQPSDKPRSEKQEKDFETIFREILGEEDEKEEEEAEVYAGERETPQMQTEEEKPEEVKKHTGLSGVGDDFEFSAEGKIETIEDQVKKQKQQKEKHLEVIDLWAEDEETEPLHFDPQKAIIFSEIINKKH